MKAEMGTVPKSRQILSDILPLDTPLGIDIHITNYCNLKCNNCVLSQPEEVFLKSGLKQEQMKWEVFQLLVKQLQDFPEKIKLVTICGFGACCIGECITHPKLVEMVKALRDSNKVETIQVIANATTLTPKLCEQLIEAGLNDLKISLHGITAEKYKETVNFDLDWEKFYNTICYFSKIKGDCKLGIRISESSLEEKEEAVLYKLFGDISNSITINKSNMLTQSSYLINNELTDNCTFNKNKCSRLFTRIDILPDGQYIQYCHKSFGFEKNIKEESICSQWNCYGQNKLRYNMLESGISDFQQCQFCTMNSQRVEDMLDGHEEEILERMGQKGMLYES